MQGQQAVIIRSWAITINREPLGCSFF